MKQEFSVIELACVVKELQVVCGARINKVVQYSPKAIALECFKTGVGRIFLNVHRPGLLWLGVSKGVSVDVGFYKNLSKQITGARIVSVAQVGGERVVKMVLTIAQKSFTLYIELFNKGEVVLCNNDGKIVSVWETQVWKDRELKAGATYVVPKKMVNVFEISEDEFKSTLKIVQESVSKTLATDLGIGGLYAQELCLLSGVDKNNAKLSSEELRVLYANLNLLLEKNTDAKVVCDNGVVKDIVPFVLKMYASLKQSSFQSYCEAIDSVMSKSMAEDVSAKSTSQFENKRKKLANIIEVQKLHRSVVEKESIDEQRKGELIYEQYQKLKEIVDSVNKAVEKMSFKEIKLRAKEFGLKDFDDVTGELIVEV